MRQRPDQSDLDLIMPNPSFYMLHELLHSCYNNHHPTAKLCKYMMK